jgi:cytochrome P450
MGERGSQTRFDPFDPDQRSSHHEAMAELRRACPVSRLASGMAVVPGYDAARAALTDPALRNSHAARAPGTDVPPEDQLFFFEYDPPVHVPLRRVLLDLFARPRLAREAPGMRRLVDELLVPLVADGGGEVVGRFSAPLAGRSMMRLAGFPEADAERWRGWISDMIGSGFSFTNRNERGVGFEECYPELLAYLDDHLAELDRQVATGEIDRRDDAGARAVTGEIDGRRLDHTLRRMILFSVVSAGTNTLTNFVSNTVLSLAREPGLLARLRADPTLVPAAVEESLRRDSPSMFLTRVAPEGHRLADVEIPRGGKVLVGLASGNRDEAVFGDPDEFRLDRDGQPQHLAFGWGAHLCIGAPLVRVLGARMIEGWVDAVETLELTPGTEPQPYLSPQGNGLDRLEVRLAPRTGP